MIVYIYIIISLRGNLIVLENNIYNVKYMGIFDNFN